MRQARRTDAHTANHINRALEIDRAGGAVNAWLYLMHRGVATDTIQGVPLLEERQPSQGGLAVRVGYEIIVGPDDCATEGNCPDLVVQKT